MPALNWRFWLETVAGFASTLLFLVTLAWPDWLELGFGIDLDQGSGAVEWLIVTLAAVAALCCFALARLEWRKAQRRVSSRAS